MALRFILLNGGSKPPPYQFCARPCTVFVTASYPFVPFSYGALGIILHNGGSKPPPYKKVLRHRCHGFTPYSCKIAAHLVGTGVLDGPKAVDKANAWSYKNALGYDRKNGNCFV